MLGLGLGLNKLSNSFGAGSFSLSTALHQWSYENTEIVGTTMTATDFGSVGGLDGTNPDAASLPTLNAADIEFDGVAEYLMKTVSNFRGSDTTGVVHMYIDIPTGDSTLSFCSADNATNTEYLILDSSSSDKARILTRSGGAIRSLETTATYSGVKLISIVQDGAQAYVLIDAVKIASYSTSTLTTEWFNGFTNRDNISFGGLIGSSPVLKPSKMKYVGYCPYVSEAQAISEANEILNSNL